MDIFSKRSNYLDDLFGGVFARVGQSVNREERQGII
jgi:hypothetical protein